MWHLDARAASAVNEQHTEPENCIARRHLTVPAVCSVGYPVWRTSAFDDSNSLLLLRKLAALTPDENDRCLAFNKSGTVLMIMHRFTPQDAKEVEVEHLHYDSMH